MVTRSRGTLQPERTPSAQDILRVWHADRCVSVSTAQQYLRWISRFQHYCRVLGLDEVAELTRDGSSASGLGTRVHARSTPPTSVLQFVGALVAPRL
jgi:hypothetical protein